MEKYRVTHRPEAGRFETEVDGELCIAEYRIAGGTMEMTHTFVPPSREGRGIAGELVTVALQYARANGLRVRPLCSYVATFMVRRPGWSDLIA